MLRENLIFEDEELKSKVVFNHHSFCELLKWVMVKYGEKTYEEANELFVKSFLAEEPKNFDDVVGITHELIYHWAMLLVHGHMYWTKGIASDYNSFREEYVSWEREIMRQHGLKEPYQYFDL